MLKISKGDKWLVETNRLVVLHKSLIKAVAIVVSYECSLTLKWCLRKIVKVIDRILYIFYTKDEIEEIEKIYKKGA